MRHVLSSCSLFAALLPALPAQEPGYRQPPEPILSLVTAERPPSLRLSPDGTHVLLQWREAMPSLATVARPHLKLAGLRIDAPSHGPQRGEETTKLVLRRLSDLQDTALSVPRGDLDASFSADGRWLAIVRATDAGNELWLTRVADGNTRRIDGVALNRVLGGALTWLPDQQRMLCKLVVPGNPPAVPPAPAGPDLQETSGKVATVRTYQDLLTSESDADLFEHYGRSQLALVEAESGKVTRIGEPDLFSRVDIAPSGDLVLLERVRRPFSFQVPWRDFPSATEVRDLQGKTVRTIVEQPLRDGVPIGGVVTGPRGVGWLPGSGVLCWVEALDGGDPRRKVPQRDVVMVLDQMTAEPREWFRLEHRFQGFNYGDDGKLALVAEFDRQTRRQRYHRCDRTDFTRPPALLLERSTQDAYGDPGRPVQVQKPNGDALVVMAGDAIHVAGNGSSPTGDRPFLGTWDLATGARRKLFECAEGKLESFVGFVGPQRDRILVQSQSPTVPPSWQIVDLKTGKGEVLQATSDPALPYVSRIRKKLLHFKRQDGVAMSGTLYLPPEHKDGQKWPVLVWAYPQEFSQAGDAGQVRGSPHRYSRLGGSSHLWLLLNGYAVLDDASMPIVGPVRTANDTFVQQLVWNAQAAVDAVVAEGIADPQRIAVGGHSYGAFMTANLLCHCDLFAAGIARSGAYNRTLTPFGFQNEERTYWEAPEIYQQMSPFANVPKLNEPILLIHGSDDSNPGTFPVQSQRLYAALQGHGGTARLCMLPHESHGYAARESVLHCLWEMCDWLDRHVKNRNVVEAGGRK